MIKVTKWRPDTCGCEIDYQWDDAQNEDVRTHTVFEVIKACPAHSGETDKNIHYAKVLDENKRKNIVLKEILDKIPSLVIEKEQEDGTLIKVLKKGVEYKWSFDVQRNLEVNLVGASLAEKNVLKTIVNIKFPNKVKIV